MSACDHMTSIMEMQIDRVTISRCEWDCKDVLISVLRDDGVTVTYTSSELSALRARVAELEEAHVYLDESPVNYPDDDEVHTLADRIAPIVGEIIEARKTIAQQAAQLEQARDILSEWEESFSEVPPIDITIKRVRAWLSAKSAPQLEAH